MNCKLAVNCLEGLIALALTRHVATLMSKGMGWGSYKRFVKCLGEHMDFSVDSPCFSREVETLGGVTEPGAKEVDHGLSEVRAHCIQFVFLVCRFLMSSWSQMFGLCGDLLSPGFE